MSLQLFNYFFIFIINTYKMWKNKIIIEPWVQQRILYSEILSPDEKDNFLKFIAYFTTEEKEELLLMI